MAKEEENLENEEEDKKKGGMSTLKIVIIAVLFSVLLSGGLVGATFYFVSDMNAAQSSSKNDGEEDVDGDAEDDEEEAEEIEPKAPPQYLSMDPKFVVSFRNQKNARFMQFSLEVMARDNQVIEDIKSHMPVIRSSLLMLFGSQDYEEIVTREGKEKLLTEAAKEINTSLQKITGTTEQAAVVEAAYFNSFVIQ